MMRSYGSKLLEALNHIDTAKLIPIIEKGLEIERLELQVNQDDDEARERIYEAEIFLTFLHMRRLGGN